MLRIIYDSTLTGHHSEYISHLVNHITNDEIGAEKYIFVVPDAIQDKFPEIIRQSKNTDKIVWEFIPNAKCDLLHSLPAHKRSFSELVLVQSYAAKFDVREVFLLYFNIFQLGLIFIKPSFDIKGILFLQFYRMQTNTIAEKLKYYRKYWITKFYSGNSKIKTVFVLNDQKTVSFLNEKFKTSKFRMLPDPIPVYEEEANFDIYTYYNIPKEKKILLHPGTIDPRKGTYEIIEAIDLLKEQQTKEYAIVIVGKAKSNIEDCIKEKLSALKNKDLKIIFDNSFVSNERLKSLFLQSFAILMPYKNVEASSGILGHAVIANKIVLAPNSGLIGEIIKKYKLGILINNPIAADIAKGIEKLGDFTNNKTLADEFTSQHTVEVFSSFLLK